MNNNDEKLVTTIEAAGFCAMVCLGALFFLAILGSMGLMDEEMISLKQVALEALGFGVFLQPWLI